MPDRADLRQRIANLSPEQRVQLERWLMDQADADRGAGSIRPRGPGSQWPLSFGQQRLWVLHELEPGLVAYNVPRALRVRGALDVSALRRALDALVDRHESLRTAFTALRGEPVQVVGLARPVELPIVDLSGIDPAARESELARELRDEVRRPFDLSSDLMLRARLFRLAPDEHVVMTVLHHIASDGWSSGVFARELSALYGAFAAGEPSPLAPLPIQYADYAVWQRRWFDGVAEEQMRYWRERLAGPLPTLELPTDRPRPTTTTYRGGRIGELLPPELVTAVGALGRQSRATPFMTLLAGFKALLARYTGQHDVIVGTAIAGRIRVETEGLIGFFVNSLIMRSDLSGDPTVLELLSRVRQTALGAYGHQEMPFERLVQALNPERLLDRSPLFQVSLVMHEGSRSLVGLPGLESTLVEINADTTPFDLALALSPKPEGIQMRASYSADLFDPETIARMLRHYRRVLEAAVADPTRRLSQLALLDADERAQLVRGWNPPAAAAPDPSTADELFEAQARRTPDAVAVDGELGRLTYAELDARATRLALRLRREGVGADVPVGVFVERSPELVVALLAVWKAGGAYVPLDPSYPSPRIAYMLQDAGAPVVITQSRLQPQLPATGARAMVLDAPDPDAGDPRPLGPRPPLDPGHLAYVAYTSGSTGEPKGVMVSHAGLVNYLRWAMDAYRVVEGSGAPVASSVAFDLTITALFVPLLAGRPVMLVPDGPGIGPLASALRAGADLSLVKLTPSHLELLASELSPEEAGGRMRALVIGGEALSAPQLAYWRAHAPATRLINEYGPTETVVGCAVYEVPADEPAPLNVPIGRPIANMRLHVLDARLEPVPVGVPGELYIGGVGVARGYWRRPDLTAERFVPDPFGASAGDRLYRTGDLARYLPDGALEFLGRGDDQVKLRGYRIELGEIRAALAAHPDVGECAVVLREDVPGDARLVAYVVARPGQAGPTGLREFVADRLPAFMVPAHFSVLEALPLTSNGKLDRARLPVPGLDPGAAAPGRIAPRTEVEQGLAALWSEVLRVDAVGIDDNFFALGGHSLVAVRVVARIRDVFGVTMPLRRLFERPTVAQLATEIESLREGDGVAAVPVAAPAVPGSGPLPLSYFQEQFWLINQEDPRDPAYNGAHALRLRGALDVEALRAALTQLLERHEVLRTVFGLVDGQPRQTVCPAAPFDLPLVDLAGHPDAEAECRRLTAEEGRRPFDLGHDRMLRGRLLRLGEREHVLVLVMHHIASDIWSSPLLFSELGALYDAGREGRPSPLPPLPLQYGEFAVWQRKRLEGGGLAAHLDYWRQRLAGAPAAIDLPTDRPRRAQRSPSQVHERILPATIAAGVRSLGARAGATPFMTLLAGFAALLHRYTGAEDIVIGAPALARDREEVRRLIGCFVNMIALRVDLSGDPSFRDLLARVRTGALEAYDHKDAPFPRVVEAVRPARMAGRTPVFQVVLNMRDVGTSGFRLAGLEVEPGPRLDMGAMFDLMLYHHEVPDGGIRLAMQYATDLFDPATIDRMLGHAQTLLESALADPDRRLSQLAVLTRPERAALATWSGATAVQPVAGVVHAAFEAQADLRPQAPAARHAGRELTYAVLEERANRLAHHLRALGAGPDVPVGLCVQRSLDMVVGVLGILKTGAGYVPLDPAYPRERLTYMMDAVRMPIVVGHRATTDKLPAPAPDGAAPRIVCLDRDADAIAAAPATRPIVTAGAQSLLYVLFTSGSTGRPKGVAMPHGPLVNLMRWQHERSGCGVGARTLQFAPYSFDVSCQELFATLGVGGTLVIVDEDTRLDPEALLEVMLREDVERVFMPFVALEQLAQAAIAGGRVPTALREIVTAGEQPRVTGALIELFRKLPGARLDNQYGPTECHVVCAEMLDGAPDDWPVLPAIGRPVPNAVLHVLGRGGEPQPVGVPGELWVGGVPVARGYVGRPDLTAERFVADHSGGAPGAMLYRTGDLVRWTAAGRLEFLGRADQQVKVRGYRVEPGEIEAALEKAAGGAAEALVVAQPDAAGGYRLVAYLRPAGGPRPETAALRAALRASLPDYMVPSAFEWVSEWPLTPSGKVDRGALAARPLGESALEAEILHRAGANNPLEASVVGIWEELLGIRPVGVHQDFFELGGHSLLAVRMLRRVEEVCGVRLPVATLFAGATIRHLVGAILRGAKNFHRGPVTLVQEGPRPPLFFLHGDLYGGGLYCVRLAQALGPDQTFYALHPHGPYGQPLLPTIEAMAESHLETIRKLQPAGPYYLGGYCNGGLIAFDIARRLRAQGETVAFLGVLESSGANTRLRAALLPTWRKVSGAGRYYGRRAWRVWQGGPAEWAQFVRRQIDARVGAAVRRRGRAGVVLGGPGANGAAGLAGGNGMPRVDPDVDYLEDVYMPRIRAYVPRRYEGRITVFKAKESDGNRVDFGWSAVSPDVEAFEVPGTHMSFIGHHVGALAERLRACLRRAQGE